MSTNTIKSFVSFITQDKQNKRICLIADIFRNEKAVGYLELKEKEEPHIKYKQEGYLNRRFNELYDMNIYKLEDLAEDIQRSTGEYFKNMTP